MPYSQETIQLLQDSAEMGMKYRERSYNLQKRKETWKTVEDLQDTLKTACQKYSIQESTMELLMASASQILGDIFQRIGKKRKSSVKPQYRIVSPGSKNIYRYTFTRRMPTG